MRERSQRQTQSQGGFDDQHTETSERSQCEDVRVVRPHGPARKLPNEAKVKLYGLHRALISAEKLPNEANVMVYRLRGRWITTRNLPNEAKVKLYGFAAHA